ncbi:MAG: AAA-like domain-containing protein [Fibrella sp.]|nr:AAA-like domain-containing protein [Armatimonadota bacterium]
MTSRAPVVNFPPLHGDPPKSARHFFQVGGSLKPGHPSYIERPADTALFGAIKRREFSLVLAPRQVGKSSMMERTRAQLQRQGNVVAIIDLQPLGGEKDFDRWFGTIVDVIRDEIKMDFDTSVWWEANKNISPPVRFERFIHNILLKQVTGDVVLFFDEVDSVLHLPFRDDYFTTIRALYNGRAHKEELDRVVCVLIGVASASDFIQDKTRTPFNIGTTITLEDFDTGTALESLRRIFGSHGDPVVEQILHWTGGQPILTQTLASVAYELPEKDRTPDQIDAEVERLYLRSDNTTGHAQISYEPTERDRCMEQDTHFRFIRDYLKDPTSDVRKTLLCYADILNQVEVRYDPKIPVHTRLRLAGVVKLVDGRLVARNRIYVTLFDAAWVSRNLPSDNLPLAEWLASGSTPATRDPSYLLCGNALIKEQQRQATAIHLSQEERAFLVASIHSELERERIERGRERSEREREQLEWMHERQERDREREQRDAKDRWAVARTLMLSATAIVLGLAWAISLFDKSISTREQKKLNQEQTGLAMSREYASYAEREYLMGNSKMSWILSERAEKEGHTQQSEEILRKSALGSLISMIQKQGAFTSDSDGIVAMDWSPDGKFIATVGANNAMQIWRTQGNNIRTIPLENSVRVRDCKWSPDSKRIAIAGTGKTADIYDAETGVCIATLAGHKETVTGVSWSPDGNRLVTGSTDKNALLWNARTGKQTGVLTGRIGEITKISWSPDGRYVAGCLDNVIIVWNAKSRQPIVEMNGHKNAINAIAWSPDSKRLASGSSDGTARVWRVENGKAFVNLIGFNIWSLAWSPGGKNIVTCGDDSFVVWEATTGKLVDKAVLAENGKHTVLWSPNGTKVATSCTLTGEVTLWDVSRVKVLGVTELYKAVRSYLGDEVYISAEDRKRYNLY